MKNYKYLLYLLTFTFIFSNPQEWDTNGDGIFDDITDYQNSASITSQILIDGVDLGSPDDMFAAFVDGELRGIAPHYEVTFGPNQGKYFFLMLIYSYEASGETVTFQFYDSESNLVYNINEDYVFVSDDTQGNLFTPIEFTTGDVIGG